MLTWLTAIVSVVQRIPANVRFERERIQRAVRLERRLRDEFAAATWICRRHGDAWRRPNGTLQLVQGTYVMPLSDADAEDFHGYDASKR